MKQILKKTMVVFLVVIMLLGTVGSTTVQAATYRNGSKGKIVKYLQQNMNFLGFSSGIADGIYGKKTQQAVIELQQVLNLNPSGIVDEELNTLIINTVKDIQRYLVAKGYLVGKVDGIKGNATDKAYKKFQKSLGLSQTGIANSGDMKYMLADNSVNVDLSALTVWVTYLESDVCKTESTKELKDLYYYQQYGDEYLSLYKENVQYLMNNYFEKQYVSDCVTYCADIIGSNSGDVGKAAFSEAAENEFKIVLQEIWARFGWAKTLNEEMRLNAIKKLMLNIDNNILVEIGARVNKEFTAFQTGYSVVDITSKVTLANQLAEKMQLPYPTVSKMLDDAFESGNTFMDGVGFLMDSTQYAIGAIQLHQVERTMVDELLSMLGKEGDLYNDLLLLKKNMSTNPAEHFREHFLTEGLQEAICQLVGEPAAIMSALSELYQGPSVNDLVQCTLLYSYTQRLKGAVVNKYAEIVSKNGNINATDISEYEYLYAVYLSSIKVLLESIGTTFEREDIAKLAGKMNYNEYVKVCLDSISKGKESGKTDTEGNKNKEPETPQNPVEVLNVKEKIELLAQKLAGKYFTQNQKACTNTREEHARMGNACSNCYLVNCIEAEWFTKEFGEVRVEQFPKQDVDTSSIRQQNGYSCFAFTCFAQWYIYADSVSDIVNSERVAVGKFTKSFVEENVKVGDVLRVNGHSVLVYELNDTGVTVLDSNWSNMPNCMVQLHNFPYSNSNYAGQTMCISRAVSIIRDGKEIKIEHGVEGANTGEPLPQGKLCGTLDMSSSTYSSYNVGLNADMHADKAYTIHHGAKLEILGKYTNSKGNEVYHVYSPDLKMECYVSARFVKLDGTIDKVYGILDMSSTTYSGYNVGLNAEMYADKAYTIKNGARLEVLGKYTNSKGNEVYHVYSYDLQMECYVSAKYVTIVK